MSKKITTKKVKTNSQQFEITELSRLFNLTNKKRKTEPGSNAIIYGHYKGSKDQKQIKVTRGKKDSDLSIERGSIPEIELKIMLPPMDFDNFVEVLSHNPRMCSLDTSVNPPTFQIEVLFNKA